MILSPPIPNVVILKLRIYKVDRYCDITEVSVTVNGGAFEGEREESGSPGGVLQVAVAQLCGVRGQAAANREQTWHSPRVSQRFGEDLLDLLFCSHLDSGNKGGSGLAETQTSAAISVGAKTRRCFMVGTPVHCVWAGVASHSTYSDTAFKVMSASNIS